MTSIDDRTRVYLDNVKSTYPALATPHAGDGTATLNLQRVLHLIEDAFRSGRREAEEAQ